MPASSDPYLDPDTGILRNLTGATTAEQLRRAETDLVFARLTELGERYTIQPTGDLAEVSAIHRHLFQDVYAWAGEFRTVDIRRPGREPFLPAYQIRTAAGFALGALRDEGFLRGLDRDGFVDRLAALYDELNYIHPFREGNGRTQRVFWTRVARDAGWSLDWTRTSGNDNDDAARIAAEERNLNPLRMIVDRVVGDAAPQTDTARVVGIARAAFPASAQAVGDSTGLRAASHVPPGPRRSRRSDLER